MSESDLKEKNDSKIYSEKVIYASTFLGGPLVTGYMLAENFKVFNQREKVLPTWIVVVLWTILILTIAYFMPDTAGSRFLLPLCNAIIAYIGTQHLQGKNIANHIQEAKPKFGWGRSLLTSLIGAIVTIAVALPLLLLVENLNNNLVSKTFGEIENTIEYDPDNISANSIDSLGKMLTQIYFFDDYQQKYVYVKKLNNSYNLYIPVVDKEVIKDFDFDRELRIFKADLQALYPKNRIIFNIVVDDIDNVLKKLE